MKKCIIGVIVALSIHGLYGMDIVEFWENVRIVDSATVSSRDITLNLSSRWSLSSWGGWVPGEQRHFDVVSGGKVVLAPDQATVLGTRHAQITFTPVSFKTRHKGFRMERLLFGAGTLIGRPADIAYIAFSDSPLTVGENDVVMVMENGEWVKAENSRSLEIAKLGWNAEDLINEAETIMQSPEMMASVLAHPKSAQLWKTLIERGLIGQNAKSESPGPVEKSPVSEEPITATETPANIAEGEQGEPSEANPKIPSLWPYALIPLGLLAVFYFLRRKKR